MELVLRDPTVQPEVVTVSLAPRPPDLRGKRLGLMKNGKRNAGELLEQVFQLLEPELRPSEVIRREVPSSVLASNEVLDEIAKECDLVISAVGD